MSSFDYHTDAAVKNLESFRTAIVDYTNAATPNFESIAQLALQAACLQRELKGMHSAKVIVVPVSARRSGYAIVCL